MREKIKIDRQLKENNRGVYGIFLIRCDDLDEQCAYMRLKELFKSCRQATNSTYAEVRINKCYIKYIKDLGYYFASRIEYAPLKILNEYLRVFMEEDIENISTFLNLNEDIKVRVLSNI